MAKKEPTVIQLPEWDGWRIAGSDNDWQIQCRAMRGGAAEWIGTHFYSGLEYAIGAAYERTLRESGKIVDLRDVPKECARVADKLMRAVRKAVA